MLSVQYRKLVKDISVSVLKKRFPGLNREAMQEAGKEIAKNIHARMYGANVDGVASPIWRLEGDPQPNVDATELLKQE